MPIDDLVFQNNKSHDHGFFVKSTTRRTMLTGTILDKRLYANS